MSLFNSFAQSEMIHAPYQGAAPAAQVAMAGQIDLVIMPMTPVSSFRSKRTAFGVASSSRIESVKDIPTLSEQGTPALANAWVGALAPPKTLRAIAAALAKAFTDTMADPEVTAKLNAVGRVPFSGTREQFAATLPMTSLFRARRFAPPASRSRTEMSKGRSDLASIRQIAESRCSPELTGEPPEKRPKGEGASITARIY